MDRYANDLIERFRDLMPATALDASGEGLFVDGGAGGTTGLAGRIEVNAAVDPRRRRRGLAAARRALGRDPRAPSGNGANLQALSDAMSAARDPIGFVSQNAKAGGALMASEIASFFAGRERAQRREQGLPDRAAVDAGRAGDRARPASTPTPSSQSLTLVEQTYAANAHVLSVIDELMKLLLE